MDKIQVKEIVDKVRWDEFVKSRTPNSFLQSWNWGKTQSLSGNKIFRRGFFRSGNLVGVMLAIKLKAKRGHHLIVPGGPIIDWKVSKIRDAFLKELKHICMQEKVWFARVRPELIDNNSTQDLFRNMGFVSAPMHLDAQNTWVIEIDKSDKEILYNMRKNTRYSIRKSLKQDFDVEMTTDENKARILYDLQKQTVKRHGFVGFPLKLFQSEIKSFGVDDQASLFLVKSDNKIHVAAIIIFYGDTAYYHYSASDSASRNNYATYFLQWKVIQEARIRGCTKYNLWGVAPNENSKKHRYYGVTVFKRGFGGKQIDWLSAQDLPVSPLYWLTYAFETGRKTIRGL